MSENNDDPQGAGELPRHTTPTWELELLISGASVFALVQLPGWLDMRLNALLPRFDETWRQALVLVFVYAKIAVLILAVTFVLHLVLRARWIALVGMRSVYPGGIRWEHLRMGPVQRECARARLGTLTQAAERADNRATTIFALGVYLGVWMLSIGAMVVAIYAVALLISRLLGPIDMTALFLSLLGLFLFPIAVATVLDRACGDRLPSKGWIGRTLAAVTNLYGRIGMTRTDNVPLALVSSHHGALRMTLLMQVIILGACVIALAQFLLGRDPQNVGSYGVLPEESTGAARTVRPDHYDSLRDPLTGAVVPYVQSEIVAGPYLELFVPYLPARDNAALRGRCPEALADSEDRAAEQQRRLKLLACLAALHPVTLDGKPLHELRYDFSTDPRSGRPTLLAMIELRGLAPGRHELLVARPDRPDQDEDEPSPSYRIPFWR